MAQMDITDKKDDAPKPAPKPEITTEDIPVDKLNRFGAKVASKTETGNQDFSVDKLNRFSGRDPVCELKALPAQVQRRLKALRKLQLEYTCLEANFYEQVHKLECTFSKSYADIFQKREKIVNGKYEPSDEECDFKDSRTDEVSIQLAEKMNLMDVNLDPKCLGIPKFWLTIFKNVALLNDMVQAHDEAILCHLQDIKVILLEKDPMGFILEFYFSPNEYFTNEVLTKEYTMKCTPDKQDPFSFEGPEILGCKGCNIAWKTGKDVTVKVIKKKQKHKSKGAIRTVMKLIRNDSFFNFFSPPLVVEDNEEGLDEETQELLTSDFEIGHYIRERIVPNAVLYYTGEALDDEEEYDDDEDEDDSDDMSSDSDNDSEGYQRSEGGETNVNAQNQLQNQVPECIQQ